MFSKKNFLFGTSYGALIAVAAMALTPIKAQAQEKETTPDIQQTVSVKDELASMTPEQIKTRHLFLKKQLEWAEKRLPNGVERMTQKGADGIQTGTDVLGKVVSTPLGWIETGLYETGQAIEKGLKKGAEYVGDTTVIPTIASALESGLSTSGQIVGSAGHIGETAIQTTGNTLASTLNAAAMATRDPVQAGQNWAADSIENTSHLVGSLIEEAGKTVYTAADSGLNTARYGVGVGIQTTVDAATKPVRLGATYLEKDTGNMDLWGCISGIAVVGLPVKPAQDALYCMGRGVTGLGQGIEVSGQLVGPIMRGNVPQMGSEFYEDVMNVVESHQQRLKTLPSEKFKQADSGVVLNTMLQPVWESMDQPLKVVYQSTFMHEMGAIFKKHTTGAKDPVKTAILNYNEAKARLDAFEGALAQREKTVSALKAKQDKTR